MSPDGKVQVATKNDPGYGNYYYSTDYGVTWTSGPGLERYFSCCVNDSGSIIIVSSDQKVYMSTDTGVTWTNYSRTIFPDGVSACNAWAVSNNGVYHIRCPNAGATQFYVSNDNMTTWRTFGTSNSNQYACSMSSDGKYQVVDGYNIGYFSSDYGISWTTSYTYFINVVTRDGTKLYSDGNRKISTDFGITWTAVSGFSSLSLYRTNWSPNFKYVTSDKVLFKMT
jgi:hypothetical protein